VSANGQVWILNPNGVLFGSHAEVSVGGLVASTLSLNDADFLAGRIGFPRIVDSVARIVSEHDGARTAVTTVADVLAVDDWARRRARELNSQGRTAGWT